jgi:hypothetical protein
VTVRVLAPAPGLTVGKTDEEILRRVLDWLRNPGDVETLVLHAPGSHLSFDRREFIVGHDGQLRPLADAC